MRLTHLSKREAEGFYAVHTARPFFGEPDRLHVVGPVRRAWRSRRRTPSRSGARPWARPTRRRPTRDAAQGLRDLDRVQRDARLGRAGDRGVRARATSFAAWSCSRVVRLAVQLRPQCSGRLGKFDGRLLIVAGRDPRGRRPSGSDGPAARPAARRHRIQRGNSTFYFPIVTCIVVSIVLSRSSPRSSGADGSRRLLRTYVHQVRPLDPPDGAGAQDDRAVRGRSGPRRRRVLRAVVVRLRHPRRRRVQDLHEHQHHRHRSRRTSIRGRSSTSRPMSASSRPTPSRWHARSSTSGSRATS